MSHLERMEDNRLSRVVMTSQPRGYVSVGRPETSSAPNPCSDGGGGGGGMFICLHQMFGQGGYESGRGRWLNLRS